ncbi:hypothetical protein IC762_09835 [Bradyrhizobium genosp. L]|uniref:hypothetical protein n=1 Tax=Bradyrhizobium genosp. L TaxID=83637 RepID=UPI0018A283A0|nr:hypothetical protein [Bradyrhizobium genosp. L]QPF86551.1 hypothetical protein IC762_09835 [Bradyrhizobium genosp. L]
MNIAGIANRIRKGDLEYALGRFKTVRVAYGAMRRVIDPPAPILAEDDMRRTLFPGSDVGEIVRTIRQEAVFVGLTLPADTVAEIDAFGRSEPLFAGYDPNGPTFRYGDVVRGKAPDGRAVPIGGIRNPARCPAIQAVIDDPMLRAIVRGYLGHEPHRIMTILDWSFASDFSDEERRRLRHHVIDYHYDVGGYNFLYASFYITPTDRNSGAHRMMKRSHDRKPMRMLLGSAVASETTVRQLYGIENEITIEGPAGMGFVQDTSCYHRATPPTHGDRLMLAVRFIN